MTASFNIPRIVIAGTSSGVGKTTFMVGLSRALTKRGLRVATFKVGPDYLDPTYHARAIGPISQDGPIIKDGAVSQNLDSWMMGREALLGTFTSASRNADIALIEGVMGLFDGVSASSEEGSTAEVAKWLDAPVLLAVDTSGMARTLAALVHGCATFDPSLNVAGVLCNRVGSRSHLDLLREAVSTVPVLGGLPKEPTLRFPERHLGLLTASEESLGESQMDAWAERVEAWCDVNQILAIARDASPLATTAILQATNVAPSCRIGYALDEAFHFYYEDNLRRLETLGATLVPFSPMVDQKLPEVDGLYLGGGYPEVHAAALAANTSMRSAILRFADAGGPVYAECGGLMYLAQGIRTLDGTLYPMVGLIAGEAVMHDRLQRLGYVEVETIADSILGSAGQMFRGHQFRYSELLGLTDATPCIYRATRRRTGAVEREGYASGRNVVASYIHAHWASNPAMAANFVASCAVYRKDRHELETAADEPSIVAEEEQRTIRIRSNA